MKRIKKETAYGGQKKWPMVTLGEMCNIFNGSTPFRGNKLFWKNGTVPWFTVDDIRWQGRKITETKQKITEEALQKTSVKLLPKNTILLCCTASIGEYAITKIELTTNQQFNGLVINEAYIKRLLTEFLFQQASTFKNRLLDISGKTSIDFVSIEKLKNLTIPLPSLSEQNRIVEILSTWDQAIETLDKLISAKEKQFKWLLKKLITNQKNNPNWKKEKLETILNYEQPTNYIVSSTRYNDQYDTPVLTAGKTFIIGYTNEKDGIFPIQKLPVIIFDDFTTAKQFVDFPFKVKSSAMKILLPKRETVNMKFVFYSMKNINFQIKSHKRFWISQYSKIKIPLPSLSKQERIIKIISTGEKEIKILQQLSNKYQEQKKALMQKLLTGKWRLKI